MKTVCQVIDYGGTTGGSFIPALGHLARAVRARGARFAVIASDIPGATWKPELEASGAQVTLVRDRSEAARALRAIHPDVIHSHFTTYDLTVAQSKARVFWHVHSVRENRSAVAELRARLKYQVLSRNVREWLCVSDGIRREVVERGAPRERVRVVANGTDTERFRPPTASERAEARRSFGIAPNDRVVLFFDRTPVKGGRVLREAMAQLSGYRLLLNGGPDAEWEEFGRQYDVIRAPRMADPRPLYWAADVLTLPSLGEGSPFVLSEGAATGLPVAASDIPPVLEMLGGCADAFIFPTGNARALADAIGAAFGCGRPQEGRTRICESFSLERWTRDLVRTYIG